MHISWSKKFGRRAARHLVACFTIVLIATSCANGAETLSDVEGSDSDVTGTIFFPTPSVVRLDADETVRVFYPIHVPGIIAEGVDTYSPGDPNYEELRELLGEIPVGELVSVPAQ